MKSKHLIILSLFLFSSLTIKAQKGIVNKQIGITFSSFGANEPIYFSDLDGAPSYDSKGFYTIGVNYIHPLNNWLNIETGIEYAKHSISVHPNLPPNMDKSSYNAAFSLINIPITVRANFLKYLFINGGMLIGIHASSSSPIDSQTGVGAILGIGAQYEFNNGIGLFVNPYSKAHALIPFSAEKYHQRLMEAGVKIGLTYSFKTN